MMSDREFRARRSGNYDERIREYHPDNHEINHTAIIAAAIAVFFGVYVVPRIIAAITWYQNFGVGFRWL